MNIATVDIQRKSQIRETEKDKDYRKQFFYSIIQSSKEDDGEPGGESEQNVTNGNEQDNELSAESNQLSNTDEHTNGESKKKETGGGEKADCGGNTAVESKGNITEESEKETEVQIGDESNKETLGSSKSATEEGALPENDKNIDRSNNEKLEDDSESNSERVANKQKGSGEVQLEETRDEEEDGVADNKDAKDLMKEIQNDESEVVDNELVKKSSEKEAVTTATSEIGVSKRQSDGTERNESLHDVKETDVKETDDTAVVNEPVGNSTEEQETFNDVSKDNDLPQAIALSEVPKAHSIDISKVKMANGNEDKRKESTSEPTSPTTPNSPHEARPLIPEFLWSPMHQRLLADILFAIESDLQVWRRYVFSAFVMLEIYFECPNR